MNKTAASQTIVASSVFLDLVDFSKLPTTAQVLAKDRFNATLRLGLSELGESNYWVRDLGDGALIICPNSPEHALFVALKVHQEFSSFAAVPGLPALELRIGLNLGVLKSNLDLEGRANYLGDGINATQRVMDFAQPGQILASRAFVDAVAFLHADYATMFLSPQSRQDKHGRTHEVYAVQPSLETLERLREEVTVKELQLSHSNAPQPGLATTTSTPLPTPQTNLHEHTITIIRNWFIPFNALLATVGVLWTGFQRFGLSGWYAQLFGLVLVVIGSALWLISRRRSASAQAGATQSSSPRTVTAIGLLLAAIGCMVTATAWISTSSKKLPSSSPMQTLSVPRQEDATRATPLSPSRTPEAPPPAYSATPTANAAVKVVTSAKMRLSTNAATVPALGPSTEADRTRCAVLLNRLALGESISTTEKQEFMQSCR